MRTIGLIQARMGSSRLPGKVMLDLAGRPLVWHMIDRLRRVPELDEIVLATTMDRRNEPLVAFAASQGIKIYRVDAEDDLVLRIAGAARQLSADYVLRTAGDCPLIDPEILSRMVQRALAADRPDFVSNRVIWSFPLGLSADVISAAAIEWCERNLTLPEERELFAVWIRDHPERFKVVPFQNDVDLSQHSWTVDEPQDAVFMKELFAALYRPGEVFGLGDVLTYLAQRDAGTR
jgi:spore coat polysaccharide biosynthesis protein SpsF